MKTNEQNTADLLRTSTTLTDRESRLMAALSAVKAQRDELLKTIKGAIAALSQPVTFTRERSEREHVRAYKILNADVSTARQWLHSAIANAEKGNQ